MSLYCWATLFSEVFRDWACGQSCMGMILWIVAGFDWRGQEGNKRYTSKTRHMIDRPSGQGHEVKRLEA